MEWFTSVPATHWLYIVDGNAVNLLLVTDLLSAIVNPYPLCLLDRVCFLKVLKLHRMLKLKGYFCT